MENLSSFFPIILMFAVLYFILVRPQQKRQKEQRDMVNALSPDDEVATTGGLLGIVAGVTEHHVILRMAGGSDIIVLKSAVGTLLPKGTIDSILNPVVPPQLSDENSPPTDTETP